MKTLYYQHIYLNSGFQIKDKPTTNKFHYCMQLGDWCWQQLGENPLSIVSFLKKYLPTPKRKVKGKR